ncbi:MAG: hypothetical protein AAF702_49105 [Chloroflexota bacterium]
MRKVSSFLILILLFVAACRPVIDGGPNAIDEGPEVIAELAAQIPDDLQTTRGYRNCELFDLGIEDDQVVVHVWNNAGQDHDCSDEWLASIDRELYLVDGPRWQPIDYKLTVGDDLDLKFDAAAISDQDPVIREIPEGSGVTMVKAATVDIGPVRRVANRFDVTIDDSGTVPTELSQAIFAQFGGDTSYSVAEINRVFNTFWVYQASRPVYVLSDGECEYAMKYYTSAQNSTLTSEEVIQDLESLFEEMPSGYSYEVRIFSEDVYVLDLDGLQFVMNDEFGNSYDRLWCGESQISYETMK